MLVEAAVCDRMYAKRLSYCVIAFVKAAAALFFTDGGIDPARLDGHRRGLECKVDLLKVG